MLTKYQYILELMPEIKEMPGQWMTNKEIEKG